MQSRKKSKKSKQKIVHRMPPQLTSSLSYSNTFRFVCTQGAPLAFSFANLLNCMVVGTGTVTSVNLWAKVRVRYVEMWQVSALNAVNTLSLTFPGATIGATGPSKVYTDTNLGQTSACHIRAKPPRDSATSQYQISNAAIAFSTVCNTDAIIDVGLSLVGLDYIDAGTPIAGGTLIGGSVGQVYWLGLDGGNSATTYMAPIGVRTV